MYTSMDTIEPDQQTLHPPKLDNLLKASTTKKTFTQLAQNASKAEANKNS